MQTEAQIIEENIRLTEIIKKLSLAKAARLKEIEKAEVQLSTLKQQHKELESQLSQSQQPKTVEKSFLDSPRKDHRNQSMNAVEYDVSYINPHVSQNDNIVYDYSKIIYNNPKTDEQSHSDVEMDSKEDHYEYNGYLRKFYKKKEFIKQKDGQSKTNSRKAEPDTRTVISDIKGYAKPKTRK